VQSIDNVLADESFVVWPLGQDPYCYELVRILPGQPYTKSGLMRYCIYVLQASKDNLLINDAPANRDEFALGDAQELAITVQHEAAMVLVASQLIKDITNDNLHIHAIEGAKRVEKHWGHEIWLTGDPSRIFAFKRILLKAGNKTSLQYHRHKRETNFILSGTGMLHYNHELTEPAERVKPSAISTVRLSGPCVVDVFPNLVHRLEALEDMQLYEISTPELDDVVRLADDAGRRSGRISDEHA